MFIDAVHLGSTYRHVDPVRGAMMPDGLHLHVVFPDDSRRHMVINIFSAGLVACGVVVGRVSTRDAAQYRRQQG